MSNDVLLPEHGVLTFQAEGHEGGPYHSRGFHVPSAASGLTIGRGYDMKSRTKSQVRDDFLRAGLDPPMAALISQAAGLKGPEASEFIEENGLEDFEISKEVQMELFEVEYERQASEARRLATKADVTNKYGATDWDNLNPVIKDVLVDLKFRGDYTPDCRRFLQQHVVRNDLAGVAEEIGNRDRWPNVPPDRFERRRNYCMDALG